MACLLCMLKRLAATDFEWLPCCHLCKTLPRPCRADKNIIQLCYEGNNLKNKHARVMVLVHDTSSDCALQMYEVSLKHAFVTDRLMDKTD